MTERTIDILTDIEEPTPKKAQGKNTNRNRAPVVKGALQRVQISPDLLSAQLENFLGGMGDVLARLPEKLGAYDLDEMSLTVEISAKGGVSLLGTGGELGGKGGITFKLKRPPSGGAGKS